MAKIPARYIGPAPTTLVAAMGPYYAPDGTRLTDMTLHYGDEIMMEEAEVKGQSYLYDPRGQRDPLYLGTGHVIKAEHKSLSREELANLGYEFHAGRPDFETIIEEQSQPRQEEAAASQMPEEQSPTQDAPQQQQEAVQEQPQEPHLVPLESGVASTTENTMMVEEGTR